MSIFPDRNALTCHLALLLETACGGASPAQRATPPSPPSETAADGRRIVYGTSVMWCSRDASNASLGLCEPTMQDCDRLRLKALTREDLKPGPCIAQPFAACFDSESVVSGAKFKSCAPSVEQCEVMFSQSRSSPDEHLIDDRCYIYRVR